MVKYEMRLKLARAPNKCECASARKRNVIESLALGSLREYIYI